MNLHGYKMKKKSIARLLMREESDKSSQEMDLKILREITCPHCDKKINIKRKGEVEKA